MLVSRIFLVLVILFCLLASVQFFNLAVPDLIDSDKSKVMSKLYAVAYLFQAVVAMIALFSPVRIMRLLLLSLVVWHGGDIVLLFMLDLPELSIVPFIIHGVIAVLAIVCACIVKERR